MEYPASEAASLRLDAGELDHLGPLFGLFHNKLFELGRRHGHRCNTEVGKPLRDSRIGEPGIYHPIEPLDWAGGRDRVALGPRIKPGRNQPQNRSSRNGTWKIISRPTCHHQPSDSWP